MISSAMLRPTASSRDQPNISAQRSFHSAILPSARMTMTASSAVCSNRSSGLSRCGRDGIFPRPMQKETAVNPLSQEDVSKIEGTSVYGSDDGKIGHVSTALMDPSSKKIDRLVVTAGGVLGVGGHRVAIPVEQFSWDANRGTFKLGTNVADLKQMPEWVEGGQQTATGSSQPPRDMSKPSGTTTSPPTNAGGDSSSK